MSRAHAKPSAKMVPERPVRWSRNVKKVRRRPPRQRRPFESIPLQVARTAVKMPSEQGHRLYVKYVRTEMPPNGGEYRNHERWDIHNHATGYWSAVQEETWAESMNANMLFLQGQAHLVPAREALDQAQHLPHQDRGC